MRVLVCGGRDYYWRDLLYWVMDRLHTQHRFTLVIHGDADGADTLAKEWAIERGIPHQPFPADWSTSRSAGPLRNAQMLREGRPELVVAFPGGKGTQDMVGRSLLGGLPVTFSDEVR